MKVAFIGDVVGKPGRSMIEEYLKPLKKEFSIDFVVANTENASHGFGLSIKNANELFNAGVDMMTGGNHTWDRKEIIEILDIMPILRPYNLPIGVVGKGSIVIDNGGEKLGIINIMGHFSMPMCDNPFIKAKEAVAALKEQGAKSILIDFHAESTSEKAAMFLMLRGEVSAIIGTHTHTGTDDLMIDQNTLFLTDIGLTGCRDGVIGVDKEAPLRRFLTGLPVSFEIPKSCKRILQIVIFEIRDGKCIDAFKVKIFDNKERLIQRAYHE